MTSVPAFLQHRLGVEGTDRLVVATWITMPEHYLLEVTAGRVFHDGIGESRGADRIWDGIRTTSGVTGCRRSGCGSDNWSRSSGAAARSAATLGLQIVAMTLARDVIRLALPLERRHAPYAKWLTEPLDPSPRAFWRCPFQVLNAERFSKALMAIVTDPAVPALPRDQGGLDQLMDSTDAVENGELHLAPRRWIKGGAS